MSRRNYQPSFTSDDESVRPQSGGYDDDNQDQHQQNHDQPPKRLRRSKQQQQHQQQQQQQQQQRWHQQQSHSQSEFGQADGIDPNKGPNTGPGNDRVPTTTTTTTTTTTRPDDDTDDAVVRATREQAHKGISFVETNIHRLIMLLVVINSTFWTIHWCMALLTDWGTLLIEWFVAMGFVCLVAAAMLGFYLAGGRTKPDALTLTLGHIAKFAYLLLSGFRVIIAFLRGFVDSAQKDLVM